MNHDAAGCEAAKTVRNEASFRKYSPERLNNDFFYELAIQFIGLMNKRSSFVGPRTKQASIKRKNNLKVVYLHAATKMSPPCDLEVAFLAKQDMGMNPRLQGRKDYAAL